MSFMMINKNDVIIVNKDNIIIIIIK